jgi:hypothetical protein
LNSFCGQGLEGTRRGYRLDEVRSRIAIAAVLALVLSALVAAPALAGEVPFVPQDNDHPTANDGWQAGTCKTDIPKCSVDTPDQFFETAAGHPPVGFTQFIIKHTTSGLGHVEPEVDLKDLRVDLPIGLSVNPGAVPRCAAAHPSECSVVSKVGESQVTVSAEGLPIASSLEIKAPVYNLEPKPGQPARFGFTVEAVPSPPIPGFPAIVEPSDIYLEADVAWDSDWHEGFTIAVPKVEHVKLLMNRLVFNGEAQGPGGQGYFLTTPSTCWNPNTEAAHKHTYSTYARGDSIGNPDPNFPNGSPFVESPLPPGTFPKSCNMIPFDPKIDVGGGTNAVDSPAAVTTELKIPIEEGKPKGQETSTVRTAKVTLPQGMGLNPSAANGLAACTPQQLNKGNRNPVACPANSKIGTATVVSEALPDQPLTGDVFVGPQESRDPESGKEFQIYVHAVSDRYGVDLRLVGNVFANAKTGQLTAYFDDPAKDVFRGGNEGNGGGPNKDNIPHGLPQVPFTSFKISIDGGQKAALSSPPTCGPHETTSQLTPWSAEFGGKSASPSSKFNLAKLPGGADCPKTLGERPFAPGFSAQPKSDQAKAFTPFMAHVTRPAGQQELKGLDITLPPGATAKLAGVPYCPDATIAAAQGRSGAEERSNPSCPDSKIGVANVEAGTGDSPLKIEGSAYLAGPYEGGPLSVVVITPAIAGPFDLGNVVVRVPLFVDPETAQVHTKTDALPDVYGGTKLDIRAVFLNLNRKEFTLNGTNCNRAATAGVIKGGGSDPTNPGAYSSFAVSDDFQAKNCDKLAFKPKLKIRLFGKTKRAKHPKLRAILTARPDDANIARASVALPHALFLDQASLGTVCTRVQFAASQCPKKSIYGRARAFTPLLGKPLEGPVYLRSSNNTLPDMVAHLQGQVDIDLVGRIDSFKGGIRTTFDRVPDVPVTKFVMILPGGKKGLLVNSRSLCAKPVKAIIRIKGQNGKKANSRPKLRTPCKKKKHGKHKKHHKK